MARLLAASLVFLEPYVLPDVDAWIVGDPAVGKRVPPHSHYAQGLPKESLCREPRSQLRGEAARRDEDRRVALVLNACAPAQTPYKVHIFAWIEPLVKASSRLERHTAYDEEVGEPMAHAQPCRSAEPTVRHGVTRADE